jgi:LEA14-like dessication related protein
MKNLLPIGILGLLAYFGFKYAKKGLAAKVLNVKVRSIRLQPLSKAALIVEVINPTSTPISFDSITLDLLLNGFALSTLNYQKNTLIDANNSVQINIPFKINPLEGVQFLASFLLTKNKAKNIELAGSINGEGFVIPVSIKQTINA